MACCHRTWSPAALQVGRYGLEEKDFDFSAERVTASVHESLARLGLEYLDVVQAHDVEFGSLDQARGFASRPTSHMRHTECTVCMCMILLLQTRC